MSQIVHNGMKTIEEQSTNTIARHVAAILLGNIDNSTSGKRCLSQREMAQMIGTSWEQINRSLKYLHEEGAIKIDRHRIIVKEVLLRKISGLPLGAAQDNTVFKRRDSHVN